MSVNQFFRTQHHFVTALWIATSVALALPSASIAQDAPPTEPPGYLNTTNYRVPPPPTLTSSVQQQDVAQLAKLRDASEERKQQAFEDAGAYAYNLLLPRYSVTAGTDLNPSTTPILSWMLRRMLVDLTGTHKTNIADYDGYVTQAKTANPRPRPFVTNPAIIPCETDFLYDSKDYSYPSGHAAEGRLAADLLSEVMPERASLFKERGDRFGENRIVCGVHYPSDVARGQDVADAYFAAVQGSEEYQANLDCAIWERQQSNAKPQPPTPIPPRAKSDLHPATEAGCRYLALFAAVWDNGTKKPKIPLLP